MQDWSFEELGPSRNLFSKEGVFLGPEETDLANAGEEERVTLPKLQPTESPRP